MSDYRMDIKGNIGLSDYSNIYDYIGVVDKQDNFTITIDDTKQGNINIISSMLSDNKFVICKQGYDENGRYFINAHKNTY
ncbi:hypothetical protein SAMN02745163_03449 [Clostridium cavendishii DSM 21758]|uniref:Uncharacterized protein n=1 Tax=Clostridium cavendishii DSM 21758 TaxID=1121302 RepID=A0A1M6QTW0_9CLOT|nr:hypothetical protein [Clostridium cavendishii]SHK23543.1 hypothetical protein SAMN02745163_03449 [Clostridium cavendishii DSM 21758]